MFPLLSICGFVGCIMPAMAPSGQGSERLNAQLLVDSIPSLIHTARPDGCLDYFNRPWLEYLGVTLDKVTGWNWSAVVHPEDVEGIVAKWRACLATGEVFEYETRVRSANGEYLWMFHRKVPLRDANGNMVKSSLRRIVTSYFDYYHRSRTHLSLGKDSPEPRAIQPPETGSVVVVPQVGGLHHRYERRAA